MANPAVVVDFVANTRDLQSGFKNAQSSASGFGSSLKRLGAAGAAAGFAALAGTIKLGVDEFAEAQKVGAQTATVIKSTGGAAKVSADHVGALAESLMKKSGVDDEAIQSGENLLLTFTNVRNEAGKGNDVFDQTTKAALDMSVALGTDMKSASMTLGKALNDPVKGMQKLTKQGVTFTDAQKAQAKAMAESGDVAGAQKIILGELNKEFGGSAEAAGKTLPGQLNILKQEFSNFAGMLVEKVIPPLTAVLKFLGEHKTLVVAVIGVIATLTAGMLAYNAAMKAYQVIQAAIKVATAAWTAAQWLLNVALNANPIGLVVLAIAALVAAFVLAYKHSDKFREIVDKAFDVILGAAKAVWNWLKANWPTLLAIITGPIGIAVKLVIDHWDTIKSTVKAAVDFVKTTITNAWNAVKTTTSGAWGAVSDAVKDVVHDVKTALNAFASWVSGFASGTFNTAVNRVKDVWRDIVDGARDAVSDVKGAFNGLIDWIGAVADRFANVASRIASAIKSPINSVLRAWNSLQLPRVAFTIPSFKIGPKKFGGQSIGFGPIQFPDVPLLAKGGVIGSPTLAMVGEGAGREIVAPEKLLREIVGERNVEVRVFIGDTELKGLVRAELVDHDTGLARTLLAGVA